MTSSANNVWTLLRFGASIGVARFSATNRGFCRRRRGFCSSPTAAAPTARTKPQQVDEQLLVVVGAGAAGVYASIRAKELSPRLNVLIIEKGKPLSKVKISGGGRCNVTNGHSLEKSMLAEKYPRGNKELRGSFFNIHGPQDTMCWFSEHGVELKTEDDGRVFPVSNNSASIVDCLLNEAKKIGVSMQIGKVVSEASIGDNGKLLLKVEKRTIDFVEYIKADYLLIATGSSRQGYTLAVQFGHSIVDPMPSLFTFKIDDKELSSLSGVSFPIVKAKLKLENSKKNSPEFTQVGPMLVTHWGLSGPVILRLSAWGARELFLSNYKGVLFVDFVPDIHIEDLKRILLQHKDKLGGQFKDEFVTAGGVPLSEISLDTMESRIRPNLFFAGEVLNVDGITGGFNFQNAWSGGYIAGTTIGELALSYHLQEVA